MLKASLLTTLKLYAVFLIGCKVNGAISGVSVGCKGVSVAEGPTEGVGACSVNSDTEGPTEGVDVCSGKSETEGAGVISASVSSVSASMEIEGPSPAEKLAVLSSCFS